MRMAREWRDINTVDLENGLWDDGLNGRLVEMKASSGRRGTNRAAWDCNIYIASGGTG